MAIILWSVAVTAQAGVLGQSAPLDPRAPTVAPVRDARQLYLLHCAGCHGADGGAGGPSGVPDLRRMGTLLAVPGGREFLIQVPGVMGSGLDDAQVAAVGNWMLERFVPPQDRAQTRPYTEDDARRARAAPLRDVMRTRQGLLERAPEAGIR